MCVLLSLKIKKLTGNPTSIEKMQAIRLSKSAQIITIQPQQTSGNMI